MITTVITSCRKSGCGACVSVTFSTVMLLIAIITILTNTTCIILVIPSSY